MAGGLLAIIGKAKPSAESEKPAGGGGGAEREFAREAFSALQDGDEEGFVMAFLAAVRACSKKASSGEYEPIDEE